VATLAARALAIELIVFEALGRWISTSAEASAKPVLAAASSRHAWHAELWRGRFPVIPDADLDDAVAAERSTLGALIEALAMFDALRSGPGRLAVADFVASALAREYRSALAAIDPLLDAPTARVLTLVLTDLEIPERAAGGLTDDERLALEALQGAPFPTLEVS
jgi:hypothetical protein